jgi:hypothetical protein
MADSGSTGRRPVVLGPGEGRAYPMGRISAVFKADGAETGQLYSISEWWLDPHTKGPGAYMPGIVQWFAEHPPGDTRV